MVVDKSNVDHIMRGLQSTEGVRLHNHRKKLRQRFDIIKKLGQGTYGKVQLGINKETGQEVAIKTIKKCKIYTEADLVRIRREIQIMSSVRHPNIIHIYEVFENREKIVLVMEYAAGGELYDYLSEKKVLEEAEARRIFRQISTAIFYCHKHKICHRDLKLENILLDEHRNAKIADFGLSNVFDGQRLLSTYCGSPLYASPEIVKGTPYHGPEVDCWSLGVLLYTLVYGAMPFDGSNFKRLVKQISQGNYFEPKKASSASPLIRDMLTVNAPDRATIEQICSHWWVNQNFNVSCLDIAEDLANQTPVRLDLLLSLAPPPENSEKIVVTDDQRDVSQEGPPRSMSVGSLMDLDASAEERVRSFVAREVPSENTTSEKTMKRKLEPVPSKSFSGARKKEKTKPEVDDKNEELPTETEDSAKKIESNNLVMDVDTESTKSGKKIKDTETCAKEKSGPVDEPVDVSIQENEKPKEEKVSGPDSEKSASDAITKDKPTRKSVKIVKKKVVDKKDSEVDKKEALESADAKEKSKKKKTESAVGVEGSKAVLKTEEMSPNKEAVSKEIKRDGVSRKSVDTVKQKEEKEKTPVLEEGPAKPPERRKSKIFETAEKFMTNDQKSPIQDKPKKVYIPGVKVSDFAKAFERRSSVPATTPLKTSSSKKTVTKESSPIDKKSVLLPQPTSKSAEEKNENVSSQLNQSKNEPKKEESPDKKSEEEEEKVEHQPISIDDEKLKKLKDSARNVISSVLMEEEEKKKVKKQVLKPPVPKMKAEDVENKKKSLTLQIGKETANIQVHTPENIKFPFEPEKEAANENKENLEKPKEKKTAKLEITLKSNTLPRRTPKAEMRLPSPQVKPETGNFRTEVERRVGDPSHVYTTQRSEVAFPVSAAQRPIRCMSVEPEGRMRQTPIRDLTRERIIPIQFEGKHKGENENETRDRVKELEKRDGKQKHPYQRTWSLRSNSLSRQSTQDSDTESTMSAPGDAIKKSPREFIIPIAVEGGGYVTPRATSLEPSDSMSSKRGHRPFSRKVSLFSENGSEDETPFSSLQRHSSRDVDEPFRLHRLRSSRPTRSSVEKGDSGSGSEEEEEDDDGFELLTAENLFSTLLSRVRSLTQRLNVEDGMRPGFPSSRLLSNHFGPSERFFSNFHQPMTRLSDRPEFRRCLSRNKENNDSTRLSRENIKSSESNRSVPKGKPKSKRSDSDTESISESSSTSQHLKHKTTEEKKGKKFKHANRTRSMPESSPHRELVTEYVPSFDGNRALYKPRRMWSARAYDREFSPTSSYRSNIPKLLRPSSLMLEKAGVSQRFEEKKENSEDEKDSGEPKTEKGFYDILAEKYGITNVKRYDLPAEYRTSSGYISSNKLKDPNDKVEGEKEKPEDNDEDSKDKKKEMSKPKKEENSEKFLTPSEKLAAVLNRLEGKNDKKSLEKVGHVEKVTAENTFENNDVISTVSSPAQDLYKKTLLEYKKSRKNERSNSYESDKIKSRIPKKVSARNHSDLTLEGFEKSNNKEIQSKLEFEKDSRTPENSVLGKFIRRYSFDTQNTPKDDTETLEKETCESTEDKKNKMQSKNKFLSSLERKLDRLRTSSEKKYVDKAIRSLRESSLGPLDVSSENVLIKRAVSMSDCPSYRNPQGKSHSTVNSVIGLFKQFENIEFKNKDKSKPISVKQGIKEKTKESSQKKSELCFPKIEVPESVPCTPQTNCFSASYVRRPSYFTGNGLTLTKRISPSRDESPNYLTPEADKSFDSWSIGSDIGNPDDIMSKSLPRYSNFDDMSKESVSERIRRKSFFTRFNEKKRPRRSSLLSRNYDFEFENESFREKRHSSFSANPSETWARPLYYRSISSGDEHQRKSYDEIRPKPFYKSQIGESLSASRKDLSEWRRSPSRLRSGSQSPSPYSSLTLPRNFSTCDGFRTYRSRSTYSGREKPDTESSSIRPLSPSVRGVSPENEA